MPNSKLVMIIIVTIILSILGSLGYLKLTGKFDNGFVDTTGNVTVINSQVAQFKGAKIQTTTDNQLTLSEKGKVTTPPSVIFSNNSSKAKPKTVDLYINFADRSSRDLITLNWDMLNGLIQSGKITLKVHPVLTQDAYSVYSSEAMMEAAANNPKTTWGFIQKLAVIINTFQNTKNVTQGNLVDEIVKQAQKEGLQKITKESLMSGQFMGWLASARNDSRIIESGSLPGLFLDGKLINTDSIDLNRSQEFLKGLE